MVEKAGKPKYAGGLYGMLLLHTGMCCGEMLALRWCDVDLEHGFLTIEKSRSVAKNRVDNPETKYVIVESATERYYIAVRKKIKEENTINLPAFYLREGSRCMP